MEPFIKKLLRAQEEKRSILCVGLDPALPSQRSANIVPQRYLEASGEDGGRLDFCLDIVEETGGISCAFKPNQQYIAGFSADHHRRLTEAIQRQGAVSILDYKLNDIGDTVESALFHIHRWGYDAVTFNPLLGNLPSVVQMAHSLPKPVGVIVLTLTSNVEAAKYQKGARVDGEPLYLAVAREARESGADGCVVGATGHVSMDEIGAIREALGWDRAILFPGIGAQAGDPEKAIEAGRDPILINVGRAIIYAGEPREKAEEYRALFEEARQRSLRRDIGLKR